MFEPKVVFVPNADQYGEAKGRKVVPTIQASLDHLYSEGWRLTDAETVWDSTQYGLQPTGRYLYFEREVPLAKPDRTEDI